MTAAELRTLLADVPDNYDVMTAFPHFTRSFDEWGNQPFSYLCGQVDIGCEVVGMTLGQVQHPFALLCIGATMYAPGGSPCTACDKECNAKPAKEGEDEREAGDV